MDFDVNINEKQTRQLEQAISRLGSELAGEIHQYGAAESAEVAAGRARVLVPVDKGALKQSIRVHRARIRKGKGRGNIIPGAYLVAGSRRGDRAAHAVLVEYGTVNMPARPFMEPAIIDTKNSQLSAYVRGVLNRFRIVVKRLAATNAG